MTSFRLSELPTPYRSAGASPLGTHEGTVTPPEPPDPPTPTGKVYFSGSSNDFADEGGVYCYSFDATTGEHAGDLAAKQIGDEVKVTANGISENIAVTDRVEQEFDSDIMVNTFIGTVTDEYPVVRVIALCVGGAWSFIGSMEYATTTEAPDGVTLTLADPS